MNENIQLLKAERRRSTHIWQKSGTMQGPIFEAGPLTALYQKTTNAIREVDQKSWVRLESQALGFNWGLPTGLGFVKDPRDGDARVALCPHIYPLPMDLGDGYAGDSKGLVNSTVEGWKSNTLRTAAALGNVPIIVGDSDVVVEPVGSARVHRHCGWQLSDGRGVLAGERIPLCAGCRWCNDHEVGCRDTHRDAHDYRRGNARDSRHTEVVFSRCRPW